MAFQSAADPTDSLLGLSQAPLMAPADISQLSHFMQLQMQQQAAQQQQVTDMLTHMLTAQNAGLPPAGNTGTGTAKALDERHFRRIAKFDNKAESWKEWRTHFLTVVRE